MLLASSQDPSTRLGWSRALAQILADVSSHTSFIVQGGVLKPIISKYLDELSKGGETSKHAGGASVQFVEALALACYYVSTGGETEKATEQGIGAALVNIGECLK